MSEPSTTPRRGFRSALIALGVTSVALATYAASTLLPEMPNAPGMESADASAVFVIEEQPLAWPETPAAIGILGHSDVRANEQDRVVPMASLAKLVPIVMAYDQRLGDDSGGYLLTERDRAYFEQAVRVDGSRVPVPLGIRVTRSDMVRLMLLASANNYALTFRDWQFGDNDTFVAQAQSWLKASGLSSMTISEPTGLSPDSTRSSAGDVVRLGMLALAHPEIAEIAAQSSAVIPGIGEIMTTNPLINDPGVRGLKTGSVRDATGTDYRNLIIARDITAAGRTITFVAAVLAQPTSEARIAAMRQLTSSIDANVQEIAVASEGEVVGRVTIWNGRSIDLVAAANATAVLTLDESAERTVTLEPVRVGTPAGATVGQISVATPTGTILVDVLLSESVPEPDAWWRLTHPFAVWGWGE